MTITDPPSSVETPAPVLSKEDLEREQLRLTNERLKIETSKLRQEMAETWWSRFIKQAVAFGGVATVAATFYGIWDSYGKTIADRERTRAAEQRIRFEDAVKRLESSSTISKLVGVSVLSGYLTNDTKEMHREVLFTLAGLMATEKDPQTQAAVINLMASIPKNGPIASADWRYFQDMLVTQSRALIAKGDLLRHRYFETASPLTGDERAARTVSKLIVGNIGKGVVSDYSNYRGIYCVECDFQGTTFPRGVDFTGAVLDHSNFSGANLDAAVFDNAELSGTKFVGADLHQAKFRTLEESAASGTSVEGDRAPSGRSRTAYLDHIASALDVNATVAIQMPNFSCANLAGANFDGHALFPGVIDLKRSYAKDDESKPGWYQNVPIYIKETAQNGSKVEFQIVRVSPPKFMKANIKDTRFENVRFFTFVSRDTDEGFTYFISGSGVRVADIVAWQGPIEDASFLQGAENDKIDKSVQQAMSIFQRRTRAAFYSVDISHAQLPQNMTDFLKKSAPSRGDLTFAFARAGAGGDPDLDCAPRAK